MPKMTEFSIRQYNLLAWLFVVISFFLTPSYSYVSNNDPCTDDTLSVQTGSANLVANWQGNSIALN